MTAPRRNEVVDLGVLLDPALEYQVLALAARAGVSRAEVIAECVRDRLTGGTFRSPFPFPVKRRERV